MPNKDGTGSEGKGPMTGMKRGKCNSDGSSVSPSKGMGLRRRANK